jgi:hypothetical protein
VPLNKNYIIFTAIICIFSEPLFAHGGGLNSYGCHNETKTGGYHCHRSQGSLPSVKSKTNLNKINKIEMKCKITIGNEFFEFKPSEAININVDFKDSDKKVNIDCGLN